MEPRRPLLSAALHSDTCVESARLGFRAGAFAIPFWQNESARGPPHFPEGASLSRNGVRLHAAGGKCDCQSHVLDERHESCGFGPRSSYLPGGDCFAAAASARVTLDSNGSAV